MADEVYLFSESYTYKPDAVATSSGGNDIAGHLPADSIDYDMNSYWENDAALPVLKIDLGAATYAIDSLWFKHSNIDTYTLEHSPDDIVYTAVADGDAGSGGSSQWLTEFTEQTKRYWKLSVTAKVGGGNTYIYDIMLMKMRLAITDPDNMPAMITVVPGDRSGGSYELANGALTSYSGEKTHVGIDLSFTYTPKANRDNLLALYNTDADGNANLRSSLVIFPDSEYPDDIYRVLWSDTNFPLTYQIGYKLSGWKGTLKFQEY